MNKQDITRWIKIIAKIVETIADAIDADGGEEMNLNYIFLYQDL